MMGMGMIAGFIFRDGNTVFAVAVPRSQRTVFPSRFLPVIALRHFRAGAVLSPTRARMMNPKIPTMRGLTLAAISRRSSGACSWGSSSIVVVVLAVARAFLSVLVAMA